jgi:hypothetical protein
MLGFVALSVFAIAQDEMNVLAYQAINDRASASDWGL